MQKAQHTTPFFSIVMPCFNSEAHLKKAVDSIISQDFTDWELLIINDGSVDKTEALAAQYAQDDSRIQVFTHPENRGLSAARSTGISHARGTYLWICDSDDWCEITLLSAVYGSLQRNPAKVVIFGHTEEYFDANDRFLHSRDFSLPGKEFRSASELRAIILSLEQGTHYGYTWNKVYDLSYLGTLSLTFTEVPLIEDIEFNVAFFQDIDSLNLIDSMPYHYAKRTGGSLTNKYVPRYFELHHTRIKMLRDQLASWNMLDDAAKAILGSLYARYILSALERSFSPQAPFDHEKRITWCNELYVDELFQELIPFAQASDSRALSSFIQALKKKKTAAIVRFGWFTHFAKSHFYSLFTRLRSQR